MLKKFQNLKVAFSINTLDEDFKTDMDNASKISERLKALRILYDEGIYTVLFMSPIFPYITDCKKIIDISKDRVCEYWFENLNLRGTYKQTILDYVGLHYPEFSDKYKRIYIKKDINAII